MLAFDTILPWELGELKAMKKETFADRLKRARERMGLNQSELARRVGVKPQSVQQWETGQNLPAGKDRYEALGRALNVSPQWLEYGEKAMGPAIDHAALERIVSAVKGAEAELGIELTPDEAAQIMTDLYKIATKDFQKQPQALETIGIVAETLIRRLKMS